MVIIIDGHPFEYELRSLAMMFFPGVRLIIRTEKENITGDFVHTRIQQEGDRLALFCAVSIGGQYCHDTVDASSPHLSSKENLWALARMEYGLLAKLTGIRPAWGILTGIRPAKLVRMLREKGLEDAQIRQKLQDEYFVSPQKLNLVMDTAANEQAILAQLADDRFSLYVSIPFCPSRCAYCSFISQSVAAAGALVPEYLSKLEEELILTAQIAGELGLKPQTIYIGGGTPTTLSVAQLAHLMETIQQHFNLSALAEYTVEAGRPDTVDIHKLQAILAGGGDRISINPQTLNNAVLKTIGRSHSAQDFLDAFALARRAGFTRINTDLIAGLPGDTSESLASTLRQIIDLDPENITVHTLSHKKSAHLDRDILEQGIAQTVAQMVQMSQDMLTEAGYLPYYLYRQKNTVGNLENVGFSKREAFCLYNVNIMDESQNILAVGAGGVTKLQGNASQRLKRIYNFKYPFEYLSGFDEIRKRKYEIKEYFGNFI